ncbi:sensor histidine kinase [Dyella jiangningensis]|uniref:sensor histidine kinase n=1 Tax=Dyella jiangningensis TaxID=1379159 RepID=UPI00192DB003|nr:HWE histidine kinase domain-containing protein [Dyella jiangningensis]
MTACEHSWTRESFADEVTARLGMWPNFFRVPMAPGLIESLWSLAQSSYLDNPLPSLFKERLFVHLSRFSEVHYCIVRHVGFLVGQGRPAGDGTVHPLELAQVMRLLRKPVPDAAALDRILLHMETSADIVELPAADTEAEGQLFDALTVMFLAPTRATRARKAVRRYVGVHNYEWLAAFLAFVHTAHYWTEMHPELEVEPDMVDYMQLHPELAALLFDEGGALRMSPGALLRKAIDELDRAEEALIDSRSLRKQDLWFAAQRQAFKAAMNGASLKASLGVLIAAATGSATDGRRCAFYIADVSGSHLTHVVGMPESYAAAVDGFVISPESLACGLAVATGEPVVTPDVLQDSRWSPWTWLAGEFGYRGCWSFPVETSTGRLVGSFAFYFEEPKAPEASDYELAAAMTQAAAIIISRHQENEERVRVEERQQVLIAELHHRTRNLMGVIHSMADKIASTSVDLADFYERFNDRLVALSRVQSLLSRLDDHDRVTFDDVIRTEFAAMDGSSHRVVLAGPPGIRLRSSSVQTLALALHELATNAMKYGALSQTRAGLAVTWSMQPLGPEGEPWLHVEWRETGVKMPISGDAQLKRRGQGRELIEQALPYQLNASTSYVLGPDGLTCTISLPVSRSMS